MPAGACCALPYRLCHVNGCRNRGNRWLAAVAMILAALVVSVPASAQSGSAYPTQTIKLIVPYAPGGSADFTARLISQKMSEGLRQTIVVDNKPGANGIIGATVVARAAPDGYTLLLAPRELAINPSIHATSPYDVLNSFAWIGVATEGHFVLVVNPSVNAHSLSELIALAKSAPGSLAYGSIGIGSVAQLNFEALKQQLSVDITHVPYKGAGPAIQATIGGEIGLTLSAIPGAIGFIRSGDIWPLAIISPICCIIPPICCIRPVICWCMPAIMPGPIGPAPGGGACCAYTIANVPTRTVSRIVRIVFIGHLSWVRVKNVERPTRLNSGVFHRRPAPYCAGAFSKVALHPAEEK